MKVKDIYAFLFIIILFIFTTGIVLPWMINSVTMPIWLIIPFLGLSIIFLVLSIEPYYKKLLKAILNYCKCQD